ncbi:MAG TPA: hypothetical protein DCR40_04200 [Prolixibacteraceae bacterium]|nr:hypothetical protein [Prolixibacteraceae bacterium]
MESKKSTPKKNTVTVTIPCSNSHSIPVFEDFMAEAQRRFQVECDAKNKAYSFILSTGRLREFEEFCKLTQGLNHHGNCIDHLALIIPNQQ